MNIDKKILDFISKHRISVLTTLLAGGSPHSASMHFATGTENLDFIFFTKEKSRKCEHFETNKDYPASLVVGFSEEEWTEIQMEGTIKKLPRDNSEDEIKTFASKYDGAQIDNEHGVLKCTPKW